MTQAAHPDPDARKGATENTSPNAPCLDTARPGEAHNRLANQLPHRESDLRIKDADSDFPEPGPSPEHS
ncbi:MAG TPA: hypothetical protein VME18_12305 [Acidobacteriaceae bacterium]|nr:hypothetical protein [Acidobacteriaceae bacterium]